MKTKFKFLAGILTVLLVASVISVVSATMLIPANDKAEENAQGPKITPPGLERVDLIHYAKPNNPGKPGKPGTTETCYKLLGVKWSTNSLPVSYVINPTNPQGLTPEFITSAISASAETWDAATSADLFGGYSPDYSAQWGELDSKNALVFGDYPQDGVIAVTTYWYTRVGKQIVEFDVLFDTDFVWGNADTNNDGKNESAVMDLQNIATHELGHGVGLNDLYKISCSQETMYGYSTEGEIQKRTLTQPDITGLQSMYGA